MVYYKKYRHNFFRNIFNNKNTKYYALIILIFIMLSGFIFKYVNVNTPNTDKDISKSKIDEIDEMMNGIDATLPEYIIVQTSKAYDIRLNLAKNIINVYDNNELIKTFLCSPSSSISDEDMAKDFKIEDKKVWKQNSNKYYSQYVTILTDNLLIESVPYKTSDKSTIVKSYYNNIGGKIGENNVIYLMSGDADWIYNNCTKDSTFKIYKDANEADHVLSANKINLTWCIDWDPTDTDSSNPYVKTHVDYFEGIKDRVVYAGSEFNPLDGVKAYDTDKNDISSKIVINGNLNTQVAGEYIISYVIADIYGETKVWDCKITVVNNQ